MEQSDQGLEQRDQGLERDEILPFHSHNTNLDDLENVQGFNSIGKRNELYCFKLTKNGMYIRHSLNSTEENKNDYEIDIILKNNMVICKGESAHGQLPKAESGLWPTACRAESNFVNRIINSGSMFGNFVSDNKTILQKINKNYYISTNDLTILNFKTQFPEDLKLLTNPPKESEFIIEGVLLDSFYDELELLKGLFVSVEDTLYIPHYTNFQIIITKNEENFNIKSFPEELKIRTEYDINLNTIKINNKILLSSIKFRT